MTLQIVYAMEDAPATYSKSIFLAGPTPRSSDVKGWRDEAVSLLEQLGYNGVVFIPEPRDQKWHEEYTAQVEWEQLYRRIADVNVFWVPRDLSDMPAFTTNIEFGQDYENGKAIYGRPDGVPKCDYMDVLYEQQTGNKPCTSLEETLSAAVEFLGDGAERTNGERYIPYHVWRMPHFQQWLDAQKAVGNRLDDANVQGQFFAGPSKYLFFFRVWVKVWIESEQRHKENEFFLARPDISVIVAYHMPFHANDVNDYKVLLVKEFRSTVRNQKGMVFELPGGSSFKPGQNPLEVASDELYEEAGLRIDKDRFTLRTNRQMCATFSTHHAHCFSVSLTAEEWKYVEEMYEQKKTFGNIEDSELTYIVAASVREMREKYPVDWSMLGLVLDTLVDQ